MSIDVCDESQAIREAMKPLGWQYAGGGPYPFEPVMRFVNAEGQRLIVSVREKS